MQRITLDQLLIEGFKCFRDKTIVQFPDKGGFYFLTGNNGPEPRLGANGAGKSSLWDALCWCWYGVSVRGNKASEITSWGVKRAHVANDFTIGDTRHRVERWGSPDRLVLDGVVIAQPALDTVLGLSRQRFLHSVLFGQGAPLFLDLTVPQRGDLLDEVLDLGLWMRLSKRASTRVATMEKALIEHRKEIAYNEGRLRGLPDENLLRQQEANWNADNDANLTNIANQIEKLEAAVDVLDKRVTHLAGQRAKLPNIDATNATMRGLDTALSDKRVEITRITDARQRDNALVAFYRSHKDCPTCKQGLSEDFIASQIHTLERDVAGASVDLDALHDQFETIMAKRERLRTELDEQIIKLRTVDNELTEATTARNLQARALDTLTAELDRLLTPVKNPFSEALARLADQRRGVAATQQQTALAIADLTVELDRTKYWQEGFKRVRLFQIKSALSMLELETANAASALGLPGWRISYVTEIETKSGTMRPGVRVQVTSPTVSAPWEVWSGGEGQRIRLAVQLGIAAMVQRMCGITFGFEVWDEPSNWLSPEGIDDLLECLRWRADATGRAVWLLDHRALSFGGFDEVWLADKTSEGTTIELIQENTR